MIRESRGAAEELNASFGVKAMLPLAVATSIDALAVGVTFAFLSVDIVPAVCLIGGITFILSVAASTWAACSAPGPDPWRNSPAASSSSSSALRYCSSTWASLVDIIHTHSASGGALFYIKRAPR